MIAVAYRYSWLTASQQREAVASASQDPMPSMRLRAQLSSRDPGAYVYLRSPDGSWQVMSAVWPADLASVRIATEEERAR